MSYRFKPVLTHPRLGDGAAVPVPAPAPSTPHRPRTGKGLDDIIRKLETTWSLGLRVRDHNWSPSTSGRSVADKIYGQIKRLYYSSEPALRRSIDEFNRNAHRYRSTKDRLEYFSTLLRTETGTGSKKYSGYGSPKDNPHKTLRSPAGSQVLDRNFAPKTLLQTSEESHTSEYVTAAPGTPTDEEDAFSTPPLPSSPTTTSKAANRRAQASPQVGFPQAYSDLLASGPRKRPSDHNDEDDVSPTKLAKTGDGDSGESLRPRNLKQEFLSSRTTPAKPAELTTPGAIIPAVAESLSSLFSRATAAIQQSANTSFGNPHSANTSFSSIWSRPAQSEATSANTSFMTESTEADDGDVTYPKLPTSSTTIGSLEDDALIGAVEELENQRDKLSQPMSELSLVSPSQRRTMSPQLEESPRRVVTPAGGATKDAKDISSTKSVMQHQIRDLPEHGLFVDDVPDRMRAAPFIQRWECTRIALDNKVQPADIMREYDRNLDYDSFYKQLEDNPGCGKLKARETRRAWSASDNHCQGYTLKAKLTFNERNVGPVFQLCLQTLQPDDSSRFQRAFGSDRFLYLTVPSFRSNTVPRHYKLEGRTDDLNQKYTEWLAKVHSFVGRKWRVFHVEDLKPKKGTRRNNDEDYGQRVVLFATHGCDLKPRTRTCPLTERALSIGEMLNWFFPFILNAHLPFCKAFARIDLGLSRTTPTLTFRPSQVFLRTPDTFADGTPEDHQFNDLRLDWKEPIAQHIVMNDGCSMISVGAAMLLWKATGKSGPIPSVFQGRIGGAKGLWMLSAPTSTKDPQHLSIWIEVTDSQLKFNPHIVDTKDDLEFNPLRLTFELLAYSAGAAESDLHIAFIPIMTDRGIPLDAFSKIITQRLDFERKELLGLLPFPERLRQWVHSEVGKQEETYRSGEAPRMQAGLPQSLAEKIIFLLESGFSPIESPYLARLLHRFVDQRNIFLEQKLTVPLGKSTNLYGIADPSGVLKPGEVHLHFSSSFMDRSTGETFPYLDNREVLVSRQPACRRSDMQKVRAVFKYELAHLVDVVVFPSTGSFPLAGKLQGGDYDGDRFWICWEPELVAPFKNAPAPMNPPDPAAYGIDVDKRKISDVMDVTNLDDIDGFLKECFVFKTSPALLGQCTNFHEGLRYAENRIDSPGINAFSDLHDLLVDSAKNGYKFDQKSYDQFIRTNPHIKKKHLIVPEYKKAMKECEKPKQMTKNEVARRKGWKPDLRNPLDYLYFQIVRVHNDETLRQVDEVLESVQEDDPDVQQIYLDARNVDNPLVQQELDRMVQELRDLNRHWGARLSKEDSTADHYNETLDQCFERFQAIQPQANWPQQLVTLQYTDWELIRASALATKFPSKGPFVYHMAGNVLGLLKASKASHSRTIRWTMYSTLKPRKNKTLLVKPEDDEDLEAYESALES